MLAPVQHIGLALSAHCTCWHKYRAAVKPIVPFSSLQASYIKAADS